MLTGISRVFSNAAPIIILFVFSKVASISDLGLINYFISLITIIGIFTDFGLPEAVQKFLPQVKDSKLVYSTVVVELVLVVVAAIIFSFADIFAGGSISYGYLRLVSFCIIFSASNTIILVFNGLRLVQRSALYFIGSASSLLIVSFGLYFIGHVDPIASFLWGRLISWVIFTIIPLLDLYHSKLLEFKLFLPRRFIGFAFNNVIIIIAQTLFAQWDSILVTNLSGTAANGVYKSIAFIATLPTVLSVVISTKFLPEFSELLHLGEFSKVRKQLILIWKLMGIGLPVILVVGVLLSNLGLTIVLNADIASQGTGIFSFILLSTLLFVSASPAIAFIQALGQEGVVRTIGILQAVSFIALSWILYPAGGYVMLPYLMVAINLVYTGVLNFIAYRKLQHIEEYQGVDLL